MTNPPHRLRSSRSESIESLIRDLATEKPKRFSQEEIISFTSDLSTNIGSGGFGNVYKGQFPSGVEVAVKVLMEKDLVEEMFMAEVSTMGRTYHRNLVKLYGFCFEDDMKALVYEYMRTGALDDILYQKHFNIKWERFYRIAVETAKGLAYLHDGCYDKIIHHDIKAGNVLLDTSLTPKIADFGLAKLMNRDATHLTMTRIRGTAGFAAPETFMPFSKVTNKCDVYSFGMMLLEILGRRRNSGRKVWFPEQVWADFAEGRLDEIIEECGLTEENKEKGKILCMVALWCIQHTPETRPSMSTIIAVLDKEIHVTTPPNPFLSTNLFTSMQPSQFAEVTPAKVISTINESLPAQSNLQAEGEEEDEVLEGEDEEEEDQEEETVEEEEDQEEETVEEEVLEGEYDENDPQEEEGEEEEVAAEEGESCESDNESQTSEGSDAEESDTEYEKSRSRNLKEAESILRAYERKPHSGSEDYVVLYTTTRGLRKWARESDEVRTIIESYQDEIGGIIERDCGIDATFNDDLRKFRGTLDTPVMFVRGRMVGGADEVKKLENDGRLRTLFEGLSYHYEQMGRYCYTGS